MQVKSHFVINGTIDKYVLDFLCMEDNRDAVDNPDYDIKYIELEEKRIIDSCLLFHIINNLMGHEHIFDKFFIQLLSCYDNKTE